VVPDALPYCIFKEKMVEPLVGCFCLLLLEKANKQQFWVIILIYKMNGIKGMDSVFGLNIGHCLN
jgi:hypothetical protein